MYLIVVARTTTTPTPTAAARWNNLHIIDVVWSARACICVTFLAHIHAGSNNQRHSNDYLEAYTNTYRTIVAQSLKHFFMLPSVSVNTKGIQVDNSLPTTSTLHYITMHKNLKPIPKIYSTLTTNQNKKIWPYLIWRYMYFISESWFVFLPYKLLEMETCWTKSWRDWFENAVSIN